MLSARFIETATSPEGIMLITFSMLGTTILGVGALYLIDWLERRAMMRRRTMAASRSPRRTHPAVEVYGVPVKITTGEMREAVYDAIVEERS